MSVKKTTPKATAKKSVTNSTKAVTMEASTNAPEKMFIKEEHLNEYKQHIKAEEDLKVKSYTLIEKDALLEIEKENLKRDVINQKVARENFFGLMKQVYGDIGLTDQETGEYVHVN